MVCGRLSLFPFPYLRRDFLTKKRKRAVQFMNNPNHLKFLKEFPTLADWLSINGFSMIYSINSFETNAIISMWTDRCRSEDKTSCPQDSNNCLMIVFCMECKTVEVYARGFLGVKGNDVDIATAMNGMVKSTILEKIAHTFRDEDSTFGCFEPSS
jgi:hypothetical protein